MGGKVVCDDVTATVVGPPSRPAAAKISVAVRFPNGTIQDVRIASLSSATQTDSLPSSATLSPRQKSSFNPQSNVPRIAFEPPPRESQESRILNRECAPAQGRFSAPIPHSHGKPTHASNF